MSRKRPHTTIPEYTHRIMDRMLSDVAARNATIVDLQNDLDTETSEKHAVIKRNAELHHDNIRLQKAVKRLTAALEGAREGIRTQRAKVQVLEAKLREREA